MPNSVYLMQIGEYPQTKIGMSHRPEHRLTEVQAHNPSRVVLRYVLKVNGSAANFERTLHNTFAKYRIHYEWFSIRPEEAIQAIHDNPHLRSQVAEIIEYPRHRVVEEKKKRNAPKMSWFGLTLFALVFFSVYGIYTLGWATVHPISTLDIALVAVETMLCMLGIPAAVIIEIAGKNTQAIDLKRTSAHRRGSGE